MSCSDSGSVVVVVIVDFLNMSLYFLWDYLVLTKMSPVSFSLEGGREETPA